MKTGCRDHSTQNTLERLPCQFCSIVRSTKESFENCARDPLSEMVEVEMTLLMKTMKDDAKGDFVTGIEVDSGAEDRRSSCSDRPVLAKCD